MKCARPKILFADNKYCPGCGHGIVNRLIAEILEESGDDKKALAAFAVGCSSWMPDTFGVDCVQAQHGRAAAVACGMKRSRPECTVFAYQGDGDALAIGLSETMWAAIRNENITVIFVNNGNFGMTGGQMAPTTLAGQITTTSPGGRDPATTGYPLNVIEMMRTVDVAYLARGALTDPAAIRKTKSYIGRAFEAQRTQAGYAFVEVLSPCPTNWKMTPLDSLTHISKVVEAVYPLGEFADWKMKK
ncbi:MAG: 2-oxoglutarate oxidoreductase [Clostridiales Family XIII bacterium]|jgi:2-oxoglutarate ferredoxin oxidoreductase subunit beta|nr:2-oxoglutarate oxidoreductase [Clostridiales Family XIII bacterium]